METMSWGRAFHGIDATNTTDLEALAEAEPEIRGKKDLRRDQNREQATGRNERASPNKRERRDTKVDSVRQEKETGASLMTGAKKVPEGSDPRRGSLRCKCGN
jgi:predicted  nucleic acid-binding Zn-ribbon protein